MARKYKCSNSVVMIEQIDGLVFLSRLSDTKTGRTMLIDNRMIAYLVQAGDWIEISGDITGTEPQQIHRPFALGKDILE